MTAVSASIFAAIASSAVTRAVRSETSAAYTVPSPGFSGSPSIADIVSICEASAMSSSSRVIRSSFIVAMVYFTSLSAPSSACIAASASLS